MTSFLQPRCDDTNSPQEELRGYLYAHKYFEYLVDRIIIVHILYAPFLSRAFTRARLDPCTSLRIFIGGSFIINF